jgi:hypothetical protein
LWRWFVKEECVEEEFLSPFRFIDAASPGIVARKSALAVNTKPRD